MSATGGCGQRTVGSVILAAPDRQQCRAWAFALFVACAARARCEPRWRAYSRACRRCGDRSLCCDHRCDAVCSTPAGDRARQARCRAGSARSLPSSPISACPDGSWCRSASCSSSSRWSRRRPSPRLDASWCSRAWPCGLASCFWRLQLPEPVHTIVKRLIGRARPYVGDHDDPFHYVPFVWQPAYASMPSGHATTAFAAAVAIGVVWPRLRVLMWVYALRHCGEPGHRRRPLSERRAGRRRCSARSGRCWCATGSRRAASASRSRGDGSVRALAGPLVARIKRVARNLLAS